MLRLVQAQTRNGLLRGDELTAAATAAAILARGGHAQLIAADAAGERVIGAAIALLPGDCVLADPSCRFDDQSPRCSSFQVLSLVPWDSQRLQRC
jgi:hypothetical protein